ncbi:MAG: hypothetical protein JNM27_21850 [Leptospirales bacterium]|nr:hypothetical protein [Leptospirales bacterium]
MLKQVQCIWLLLFIVTATSCKLPKQGIRLTLEVDTGRPGLKMGTEAERKQLLHEVATAAGERAKKITGFPSSTEIQYETGQVTLKIPGQTRLTAKSIVDRITQKQAVEYRIVDDDATARVSSFSQDIERITELSRNNPANDQALMPLLSEVSNKAALRPNQELFLSWRRGLKEGSPFLPRGFVVIGPVQLDASEMHSARATKSSHSPYFEISFTLSAEGTQKFAEITRNNIGRQLAIVCNGRVVSHPTIREPILGGVAQISGDFTKEDAEQIAEVIGLGAPIPVKVVSMEEYDDSKGR